MGIDFSQPKQASIWLWFYCLLFGFTVVASQSAEAFDTSRPYLGQASGPVFLAQAQPPASEATPQAPDTPTDAPTGQDEEEEEEPEPARIPLAGVQQGGVLLQRDQLVLEPTLAYSFATNTRLIVSGFSVLPIVIIGTFESEKITTQTFPSQRCSKIS